MHFHRAILLTPNARQDSQFGHAHKKVIRKAPLEICVYYRHTCGMPVPKEIIATLSNYHLIVENESRHNEISFWIDDKRLTYQYDPVQLDLDNLRQKLRNFGATLKVSASTITTLAAPPDEAQAAPEAPKAPKAPRAPIVTNREGYTVYRSAKVIAIELAEDLKVTK